MKVLKDKRGRTPFDLYSKGDNAPEKATLMPYYKELVAEFLPTDLNW